MSLLDADDLAYMRDTQADAMPVTAVLFPGINRGPEGVGTGQTISDGMGGRLHVGDLGDPQTGVPIIVRITRMTDNTSGGTIPSDLGAKYGASELWKLKVETDTTVVTGDRIVSAGVTYQVVSEGDQGSWTTARTIWATIVNGAPA